MTWFETYFDRLNKFSLRNDTLKYVNFLNVMAKTMHQMISYL